MKKMPQLTHGNSANLLHLGAEILHNVARLNGLSELFDLILENGKGSVGDLVATVLGKQFLLSREIQVLVGHNLIPNASCIEVKTVSRNASGVLRLEHIVGV